MADLALLHLTLLFLSLVLDSEYTLAQPEAKAPAASTSTDFIDASCNSTRYPPLCVRCLSSYASMIRQNEQTLARVALSVTLSRTRQAVAFLGGTSRAQGITPREFRAVRDCVANLGGSADRLAQSIDEVDRMGRAARGDDFDWHVSNIQSWVGGALTNANTCLDGFGSRVADGNIKTTVRSKVLELAHVTSNALALMDRFAERQRRSSHGHP